MFVHMPQCVCVCVCTLAQEYVTALPIIFRLSFYTGSKRCRLYAQYSTADYNVMDWLPTDFAVRTKASRGRQAGYNALTNDYIAQTNATTDLKYIKITSVIEYDNV